jgi:hypothetical protein
MTASRTPEAEPGARAAFHVTIALFVAYAALFVYRTSFVVGDVRYFSLFDDAMISMRYAKNLASGFGLVWNAGGERVEGYTNPLWVLYMAAVHLLPIPAAKISLVVQTTAVALLVANLFAVRRVALLAAGGREAVAVGAVVLTAFYLPLNSWSLQGMEVSALVLIMSVSLWKILEALGSGTFPRAVYVLLGASTFLRLDMVVPLAGVAIFLAVCDPVNRWRHLTWSAAVLAVFIGAQTALRFWYYGEIVPNTYYLKLTGFPLLIRMGHGLFVLAWFILRSNVLLFAVALIVTVQSDRRVRLLLWTFTVQMAYSVYVGGDAWEYWGGSNRYISIAMPGFFILLSYGLFHVSRVVTTEMASRLPTFGTVARLQAWVFPLLVGYSVISVNCIYGVEALAELSLIHAPLHTGTDGENNAEVEEALLLQQITTEDATIAVARAGTIPYFTNRFSVDELGKSDRHIAHQPARGEKGLHGVIDFRPGHMKYDYAYSIGTLKPDVVVQLFENGDEAAPYLRKDYSGVRLQGTCLYFRRQSPHIIWQNLSGDRCGVR